MTEDKKMQQDYTLDAIEAVARRGERRFRIISLGILAVIVIGLSIEWYLPAELADWPVAVLLPKTNEGSVQDNAKRQWDGFKQAFADNHVPEDDRNAYFFNFPLHPLDHQATGTASSGAKDDVAVVCEKDAIEKLAETNDRLAIMHKIECWYDEGIRTFIITMSPAISEVKSLFIKWANELPSNDRPVLLATVASAPSIAERNNGVFRHYIRSRDESDTLATYIESIDPIPARVGIFHVPDEYGRSAMFLLNDRLKDRGMDSDVHKVGYDGSLDENDPIDPRNDVAVIIGYGSMIEGTLSTLKALDSFAGPILVVSTFTEENWRPRREPGDECFWDRIQYIEPITFREETDSDKRGVVFQFSYLTLERALKCRDERGVEDFWSCFINDKQLGDSGQLWNPQDIEFTEDGDSHISLRLRKLNDDEQVAATCQARQDPEPAPGSPTG